jgi:hypothetical protein
VPLEVQNSEIDDLFVTYKAMSHEGKKRMVKAAGTLLSAQKIFGAECNEAIYNPAQVACSGFKKR